MILSVTATNMKTSDESCTMTKYGSKCYSGSYYSGYCYPGTGTDCVEPYKSS